MRTKSSWILPTLAALIGGALGAGAQEQLFVSKRLTPTDEYTNQIEGPAVDAAGNLYVANFMVKTDPNTGGAIGRIAAGDTKSKLFATLPVAKKGAQIIKSKSSGIRFDRDGRMYATDFNNHNVFVFEAGQSTPKVYFHSDDFNQPNDLAIAGDGTLYVSDPKFSTPVGGQIWRITRDQSGNGVGAIMKCIDCEKMGITNGIDLSPDEKTLYVSESNTGKILSYRIDGANLADQRVLTTLAGGQVDGLRTDMSGRIYVTQNGAGKISMLTPQGKNARDPIATKGKSPSNLTFGGPDGRTVFVTQMKPETKSGYIETFRVDIPGREPCLQFKGAFCPPP
jgi:sugar lactone lactonase YvrE